MSTSHNRRKTHHHVLGSRSKTVRNFGCLLVVLLGCISAETFSISISASCVCNILVDAWVSRHPSVTLSACHSAFERGPPPNTTFQSLWLPLRGA